MDTPAPEADGPLVTYHDACKVILEYFKSQYFWSLEEALKDDGWTAAVILIANELVPICNEHFGKWDEENRGMLDRLFSNDTNSPILLGKIVEPILNNGHISGIKPESRAFAAASNYAAAFLRLVYKIFDMGPDARLEDLDYDDRIDYFRALVLWCEWHVICTCTCTERAAFLDRIYKVGIPSMFNKELLGDEWGKKYREAYCHIVEEFTRLRVSVDMVTRLWEQNLLLACYSHLARE